MSEPDEPICTTSVRRPFSFRSPFEGRDFSLLLLVAAPDVSPDEQAALAHELVSQGCRYAVCAGVDCSSWDDAIDQAVVMRDIQGAPGSGFVHTTWHENETLEEVAEFFLEVALVDGKHPKHRLAAVVGDAPGQLDELERVLGSATGRPTMRCS